MEMVMVVVVVVVAVVQVLSTRWQVVAQVLEQAVVQVVKV